VGNNRSFDPFKKIRSMPELGSHMFPCSDPTKWTSIEHPDRPVPILKKEAVRLIPALEKDFVLYLRSILWETSPFPQSLDHIQDPHDPQSPEEVGISGELRHFLDERR
jgi:hypothetical protein